MTFRINSKGLAVALALAMAMPVLAHAGSWNSSGNDNNSSQNQRCSQSREGCEAQRQPRMTPEERQQLRRDVKDAGREIYPSRR